MAAIQKLVSTVLIATLLLGKIACLCEPGVAADSPDVASHAHHASQVETSSAQACPHVDCVGNCATLSGITANDTAVTVTSRNYEPDESGVIVDFPTDQVLISSSPIYSFALHAPPVLCRATPVSRFDRILA